jgi:Fur family ferric uptake transcriptional regulator
MTPQRQIVLDCLCAAGPHATAEEIFERVHRVAAAIDRATVYRTLATLERIQVVDVARIGGRMAYEIAYGEPHHHLICRQCGKLQEVGHGPFGAMFRALERQTGFRVTMRHLTLLGLCARCSDASSAGGGERQ